MWSPGVVPFDVVSKPCTEFIIVFGSSFHPEEELFLIGTKRAFNERVFIGTAFVNTVVFELEVLAECIKSLLKLKTIVRLDEDGFKWKPRQYHEKTTHRSILIELIEDDGFLVAGVDINDGVLVAGPGETRELGCDVLHIHLQVADGRDVFCVHMNRFLIPGSDMIAVLVHESSPFQQAMNR